MSSFFEQLGRLRPDQHRPLVLAHELRAGGVFTSAQPFVPLLEVKVFKLLAQLPVNPQLSPNLTARINTTIASANSLTISGMMKRTQRV